MKTQKNLFLFFTFILFTTITQSQFTISGKIKDKNQKSVENAVILLNPISKSAISNSLGGFYFNDLKPGDYTVTIRFLGYKTYIKDVEIKNKDLNFTINL